MVRTQLQIDDDTYEALRQAAHAQHKSMSAVVRGILRESLVPEKAAVSPAEAKLKQKYPFIGIGKTGESDVSVRHDDYLAEDFA